MASPPSSIQLLLSLSLLSLLAIGATARPGVHFHPCKTLFISYTLTTSDLPQISADTNNPNPTNPSRFFAVYRIIRPVRFYTYTGGSSSFPRPVRVETSFPRVSRLPVEIAGENDRLSSFGVTSSLRERAKDIAVVVVGLLFGVGCGALTAATMYLAWSLLTNRYEICGSDGYGYDDDDEIESPKKMGYASVPPAPATPASPVKEGYEGN